MDSLSKNRNHHLLSILFLGISASLWAISFTKFWIPISWLGLLSLFMIVCDFREFSRFLVRFKKIGIVLTIFSLFQIIFRRSGEVIFHYEHLPVIYSDGLHEAVLLWIRFMTFFVLAKIFSQISLFNFVVVMNKIRLPLKFNLLLLTTLRLIPYIFRESKRTLWFFRFRGIEIRELNMRNKISALKKLLFPLIYRGIYYTSYSALALELRGYSVTSNNQIPVKYPLTPQDYPIILLTLGLNICCLLYMH